MDSVVKRACSLVPHDPTHPEYGFEVKHSRGLRDLDVARAAYNRLGELGPEATSPRLILVSDVDSFEDGKIQVAMFRADLFIGPAEPV